MLKSTPADGIGERIKAIGKGAVVLDYRAFENLYASAPVNLSSQSGAGLTQRESESLYLVAQGHSNKEIADMVHLAKEPFISAILHKLDLRNKAQIAVYYREMEKNKLCLICF